MGNPVNWVWGQFVTWLAGPAGFQGTPDNIGHVRADRSRTGRIRTSTPKAASVFVQSRFNSIRLLSVVVFGLAAFFCTWTVLAPTPLLAQSFEADFYGCWRHDSARKVEEKQGGFSVLCFRSNRTAHHISIAAEGGGDEELEWEFISKNSLVIDGQTCLVQPGSNNTQLFLTRCLFMGAWVRQCTRMTEDGAGCPK